jgi:hypothetical protein
MLQRAGTGHRSSKHPSRMCIASRSLLLDGLSRARLRRQRGHRNAEEREAERQPMQGLPTAA